MTDPLTDLSEHTPATLASELAAAGLKASHAGPLLRAYYRGGTEADSNDRRFPPQLEQCLRDQSERRLATIAGKQVAADGTTKLLIKVRDGRTVESVLMPGHRADRAAGCVSSQVGCA